MVRSWSPRCYSAGALVSVRRLGDFAKEEVKINRCKTFAQAESVKSTALAINHYEFV